MPKTIYGANSPPSPPAPSSWASPFPAEFIKEDADMVLRLRQRASGFYIANGEHDAARGARSVSEGHANATAYARPYISNPDLVERFHRCSALNEIDTGHIYRGDETGYNDYPSLSE